MHRFWNAGDEELRCTAYVGPADNLEHFPGGIFESTRRNGGTRPLDAAFLARRCRQEFALTDVPALVQRVVFPVLVDIGTLLGRYARYADAPAPIRR